MKILLIVTAIVWFVPAIAQDSTGMDVYAAIKTKDLSVLLLAEKLFEPGTTDTFKRAEPLGFIGNDFQRFRIHFVSVIRDPSNPYRYFVYGKTQVKTNTCSFQGTVTVKSARLFKDRDILPWQEGLVTCSVLLYEDNKQPGSGSIVGEWTGFFMLNESGQLYYDTAMMDADGFSNNAFTGSWTSYHTTVSKTCHWGDYRIPDCGDLDIGAGEFSVNNNYLKNGWEGYSNAYRLDPSSETAKRALAEEQKHWWE